MRTFKITHKFVKSLYLLVAITTGFSLLNSCVTTKKTSYLQEYRKSDYPTEPVTPHDYKIQPSDNLFIRVVTPDPRWSAMFNTLPATTTTFGSSEQSVDLISYIVKLDGTVEIPYLGSIPVAGKTISEAKIIMEDALYDYVTDASITVKLVNNYMSILGQVNRPGRYLIYKERLNIYEALATAGDVATFGNRYKVHVIRKTNDGSVVKEFDLTDKNIIDSEYYYILPNDVLYVEAMKGSFFAMNQFPYALILSTITTFLLISNYISE